MESHEIITNPFVVVFGVAAAFGIIGGIISCCASCGGGGSGNSTESWCDGPSADIETEGDASKLAACSTYSGDIKIDPSFEGDLNLDGSLQVITGGLTAINAAKLASISANSLSSIGSLNFQRLASFNSANLPELSTVQGSFVLQNLPQLSDLSLPALSKVQGPIILIEITQLDAIDGFPALSQAQSLDFEGDFTTLSLPLLTKISGDVKVAAITTNTSVCRFVETLKHEGIIHGKVTCSPQKTLPPLMVDWIIIAAVLGAFVFLSCTILLADKGPRFNALRRIQPAAGEEEGAIGAGSVP